MYRTNQEEMKSYLMGLGATAVITEGDSGTFGDTMSALFKVQYNVQCMYASKVYLRMDIFTATWQTNSRLQLCGREKCNEDHEASSVRLL